VLGVAADAAGLILKAMGTILLIILTTLMIFAVIFCIYVKTNMTDGLDISLEEHQMNLSSTVYMLDEDSGREEVVKLQSTEYRIWVEYEEIPQQMRDAIVAIEDKRFYTHHGVDWFRTVAAFANMFLSMKDNFGGSTLTQQLIKNLTDKDEVTVTRKLEEIFSALEFEQRYNKQEIITWYLNEVNFGGQVYGVAAAADYYFGKTLSELTLAEIVSIVGITNNPSLYNPNISSKTRENNKNRQEDILTAMLDQEYITIDEFNTAKNQKLVFKKGENSVVKPVVYSWFVESAISDVITDLARERNVSRTEAERLLYRGGYSIILTIDPRIQGIIDEVYTDLENLPAASGSAQQLQSAIVIIDPYTGYVKGIAGGVGEKTSNLVLNRATMDKGRRPVGSSIKPLSVYSLAIEKSIVTPDTIVNDTKNYTLNEAAKGWYPNNDDNKFLGLMSIRTAVARSRNTIAAQLVDKIDPKVSFAFLTDTLGFDLEPEDADYAPMALGQLTIGATPLEMASAYTMFPNGGKRMDAITYTHLYDNEGVLVIENTPRDYQAISEVTAYWVTDMLRTAVQPGGTGSVAKLDNMPSAGKTGTTSSGKDKYFCGFTPYYVCAVWTGYDIPEYISVKGGNPAAQIFKRIMEQIHADEEITPYREFNVPRYTDLPEIEGIKVVNYTIRYECDGVEFYTNTEQGIAGDRITISSHEIEGYISLDGYTKEVTLNRDSSKNIFTFNYILIEPSPEPSPSPEPIPSPSPEPMPSDDAVVTPDSTMPDAEPTSEPTWNPSEPPQGTPTETQTVEPASEPESETQTQEPQPDNSG